MSPIPPVTSEASIPWSRRIHSRNSVRVDRKLDSKRTYGEEAILWDFGRNFLGVGRMLGSFAFSSTQVSIGTIKGGGTSYWRYLQLGLLYRVLAFSQEWKRTWGEWTHEHCRLGRCGKWKLSPPGVAGNEAISLVILWRHRESLCKWRHVWIFGCLRNTGQENVRQGPAGARGPLFVLYDVGRGNPAQSFRALTCHVTSERSSRLDVHLTWPAS